jgi:hypothetical protein
LRLRVVEAKPTADSSPVRALTAADIREIDGVQLSRPRQVPVSVMLSGCNVDFLTCLQAIMAWSMELSPGTDVDARQIEAAVASTMEHAVALVSKDGNLWSECVPIGAREVAVFDIDRIKILDQATRDQTFMDLSRCWWLYQQKSEPPIVQVARESMRHLGLDPDPAVLEKSKDRSWWGDGHTRREWLERASWLHCSIAGLDAALEAGEDVDARVDSLRRLTVVLGVCVVDGCAKPTCSTCMGAKVLRHLNPVLDGKPCPNCPAEPMLGPSEWTIVERSETEPHPATGTPWRTKVVAQKGDTARSYTVTTYERDGRRPAMTYCCITPGRDVVRVSGETSLEMALDRLLCGLRDGSIQP